MGSFALAGVVLGLSACGAGWQGQVRAQASTDHRCPPERVEIVSDNGCEERRTVRLRVCGRTRVYRDYGEARPARGDRPELPQWRQVRRRGSRRSRRAEERPPRRRGRSSGGYGQQVRRAVDGVRPEITECYERARRRDARVSGVLLLRFVVGPRGQVVEAHAESEQLPGGVCRCVEDLLYNLSLPRPSTTRDQTFHYPFVFDEPR